MPIAYNPINREKAAVTRQGEWYSPADAARLQRNKRKFSSTIEQQTRADQARAATMPASRGVISQPIPTLETVGEGPILLPDMQQGAAVQAAQQDVIPELLSLTAAPGVEVYDQGRQATGVDWPIESIPTPPPAASAIAPVQSGGDMAVGGGPSIPDLVFTPPTVESPIPVDPLSRTDYFEGITIPDIVPTDAATSTPSYNPALAEALRSVIRTSGDILAPGRSAPPSGAAVYGLHPEQVRALSAEAEQRYQTDRAAGMAQEKMDMERLEQEEQQRIAERQAALAERGIDLREQGLGMDRATALADIAGDRLSADIAYATQDLAQRKAQQEYALDVAKMQQAMELANMNKALQLADIAAADRRSAASRQYAPDRVLLEDGTVGYVDRTTGKITNLGPGVSFADSSRYGVAAQPRMMSRTDVDALIQQAMMAPEGPGPMLQELLQSGNLDAAARTYAERSLAIQNNLFGGGFGEQGTGEGIVPERVQFYDSAQGPLVSIDGGVGKPISLFLPEEQTQLLELMNSRNQ